MAKSLFCCSGTLSATTAGTTQYLPLVSGATINYNSSDANAAIPYRSAGTFSNLYVRISSNSTSASSTIKTRKNASTDGNLTLSVGSGATGVFEDTTHTDSVAGTGDTWNYSLSSGGTGTFTLTAISVLFEASTSTDTVTRIATTSNAASYTGTTVRYNPIGGLNTSGSATEANSQVRIKKTLTAKYLAVTIASNSRTTSTTVKTRKNGADGAMSLSYAGGTTGIVEESSPGTNSDSLVNNDLYCTAVANGSGAQAHLISAITISLISSSSANVGVCSNGLTTGVTVNAASTVYNTTSGQFGTSYTTESNAQVDVRANFDFSNLVIFNASNSVTAASTFTFRKNGSGTALTLSIASSTSGVFENTSDTISTSSASDDLVDVELATGSTGTTMIVRNISVYTTYAGGTLFTTSITESSISVSDSNTRVLTAIRSPADTITVSDSLDRLLTVFRTISESSISVSDTVAGTLTSPSGGPPKTIISCSGSSGGTSTPRYTQAVGPFDVFTSETSLTTSKFHIAGTLSQLACYISANATTSSSTLITRKNLTTNGGQSVSIGTGATGFFEDTSGSDSVTAGDEWGYKLTLGSASSTTLLLIQMSYVAASSETVSKFTTNDRSGFSTSTTQYDQISGAVLGSTTSETTGVKLRIRKTGAFKNLSCYVSVASSAAHTINFRKNGSSSGCPSLSLTASTTGWFTETSTSVSVAAGDDVNHQIITGSNTTGLAIGAIGIDYINTSNIGLFMTANQTTQNFVKNTTGYQSFGGQITQGLTTEAQTQVKGRNSYTFSELGCYVTTNSTGVDNSYVRLRKGATDTSLTVDIDTGVTGLLFDSTNTATSSTTDLLDLAVLNAATSAGGTKNLAFRWMCVYYEDTDVTGALVTRSISETAITVSDSNTRVLTAMRPISESSISCSDSLARLLTAFRTISESTITVSDSLARLLTAFRTISAPSITVSDSLARILIANRVITETAISVSDSLARLLIAVRIISDTITVSDAINAIKLAGLFERVITESSISVSDSLARMTILLRTLSEPSISVSDSRARLLIAVRAVSEPSIVVSDTLTRIPTRVRSLADTITVSDSLARMISVFRTISESSISVSDSLVRRLTATRILSEPTISVSETLARTFGKFQTISETVTVSDFLARVLVSLRTISEPSTTVSDSLARILTAMRTLTEPSISVSDSVLRTLIGHPLLSDTITVSDSITRHLLAFRTLVDTITVSDTIAGSAPRVRIISESAIPVNDSIARRLLAFRVLGETVFVSEVMLVVGPDYEVALYISDRGYSNPLHARIQFISRNEPYPVFYTYDSFNTDARPFNIVSMSVRLAQGEIGNFSMVIEDSAGIVDKSKIGLGVKVVVEVKKEFANPYFKLITGFVRRIKPLRPATGALLYQIDGYGSQVIFNERIVNFKRAAKRTAIDSSTPLSTDSQMQAYRLFTDLITATDILPLRKPTIQSTGRFELTEVSPEVTDFIAQIAPGLTDAATVANALAEITGAIWGTDANGNPFFRYPTQKHSGILVKDAPVSTDLAANTSINMDSFDFDDSIDVSEGFANRLYILNAVDTKSGPSSSKALGSTTLTFRAIAQQWESEDNNITGAAFILSRVGNPVNASGSIFGKLRADNGGYPTGATLATFEIPISSIETSRSTVFVNDIKTKDGVINPGQKYWWLLYSDFNDDSNTIRWHHDNDLTTPDRLSGRLSLTDADPTKPGTQLTWVRSVFGPVYSFSTFRSVRHILTQSDSESIKQYGLIEGIVDLPSFDDDATFQKALAKIIYTSAKPKRTYEYARLTIPTQRLFYPGEAITLIDSKASLTSEKSVQAEIAEVNYNFDTSSNAIGCKYVDIRLIAFIDKTLDDYMENREC